jgi:hypothetical protein
MNGDTTLEAELSEALAAPPGNPLEFCLALARNIRCRRGKVNYHILSPVFLGLLHSQDDHLHGQFPVILVHVAKKGPGRRLRIPVKLDQRRMYAPIKVMMLDQPPKLGKIIGGKAIELAAIKAIARD